jgi:hypothetical protein
MADEDDKPEVAPAPPEESDVVVLGPRTADGAGVHVLRARQERLETGELRSIEEGKPISGEVVTLVPRSSNPRVCDVKDSYVPPAVAALRKTKGPAQVATQAYRDNWDEVFARDQRDTDLN